MTMGLFEKSASPFLLSEIVLYLDFQAWLVRNILIYKGKFSMIKDREWVSTLRRRKLRAGISKNCR